MSYQIFYMHTIVTIKRKLAELRMMCIEMPHVCSLMTKWEVPQLFVDKVVYIWLFVKFCPGKHSSIVHVIAVCWNITIEESDIYSGS